MHPRYRLKGSSATSTNCTGRRPSALAAPKARRDHPPWRPAGGGAEHAELSMMRRLAARFAL